MSVNIPGLISVVVCYLAILVIGIVAGRKTSKNSTKESILVADRSLGMIVSIFTLTATMVGGGYINGSAEFAAWNGVLQTQAPIGYCLSLLISAFAFAPKMRREGYITMFDPFQLKYGRKVGAILIIPQILGDLFWAAAVLAALGATISIILDVDSTLSIVISSAVAVAYTFFGGLYAVAYTDVIQLIFIFFGLFLAFPFSLTHPAVNLSRVADSWPGVVPKETIWSYIDVFLLCICGGIPWQALYQRALACKSVKVAKLSLICSSLFTLAMAVPPVMMGIAGAAADWNQTDYEGLVPLPKELHSNILPLVLTYLTPLPVGIIGIGAVAAAVMSSADSCILSSSSVLTKNIYQDIFRPNASQREASWVLRINVIIVGVLSTLIAVFSTTIYGLYVLCSDLMYVVLFPQLILILWVPLSNGYGCIAGFFISFILRLLSGEPVLSLPALIKYPLYDETNGGQLFPHRTFAMLLGLVASLLVSLLATAAFKYSILPRRFDVFKCMNNKTASVREQHKSQPKIYREHVVNADGDMAEEKMSLTVK